MGGHTALEGVHETGSPVGDGVTAMEVHLLVVSPVQIASLDASRIEARVTVEAFVASKFAKHAAGPMLPGNI